MRLSRRRHKPLDAVLALHAGGVCLFDGSGAGPQRQRVGGDEVLALGGRPARALPRLDVENVHCVDFLEGAALVLAEEKVDDEGAGEVAGCEDVAVAVVDVACDEGGEEGDEEVPEPGWLRGVSVLSFDGQWRRWMSRECP